MINLLIDSGVDVNLPDGCGKVALVEAVKKGNTKIVSILIKNGSDAKASITPSVFTPITRYFKEIDMTRLLIDWGVDVNLVDNFGTSLLVSSVEYNRLEIVSLLIDRGVNTNIKTWNGESLQHLATFGGNYDMIQLLTGNCKKIPKDEDGNYPVEAIMTKKKIHTFKKILLLQNIES